MTEVVIIGAGLTGLSAAYHLEKNGFFNYKIFEKNNTPGGLLRSFKQDGFTFDFTGHLLHISNDYFYNFLNEISDIKNYNLVTRNSAIHLENIISDYPFQMNLAQFPQNIIFDSVYGFINRKTKIRQPKSFHDWVLKYFGSGMCKHFFSPYNSKLLSYDIKKVTASWTGRFVPQTSLKKVLQGALIKRDNKNLIGYNSQFYYPKQDGIQYIIDKLKNKITNKIHFNHNVIKIDIKTKTIYFENGHKEKYKKLITTMPLNLLLKNLDEKSNTNLNKAANNLICNSVVNFNLGFNVSELTKKHWLYFPEKKYDFYRIGFWHNICPANAKKNHTSIYGEFSYLPQTKTKKQVSNLLKNSIKQSLNVLNLTNSNIATEKILFLPNAYVVYDFWREKNLNSLHKKLNEMSIYSVGRYGEWKYSSMQEAVLDGKKISNQLLKNKMSPMIKKIEKEYRI